MSLLEFIYYISNKIFLLPLSFKQRILKPRICDLKELMNNKCSAVYISPFYLSRFTFIHTHYFMYFPYSCMF